jgi:hypothetical protein
VPLCKYKQNSESGREEALVTIKVISEEQKDTDPRKPLRSEWAGILISFTELF